MNGTSRGITQRALAAVAMLILGLGTALIGLAGTSSAIEEVGDLPAPVTSDADDCVPSAGAKAFYSDWANEGAPEVTDDNVSPTPGNPDLERYVPAGQTDPEVEVPATEGVHYSWNGGNRGVNDPPTVVPPHDDWQVNVNGFDPHLQGGGDPATWVPTDPATSGLHVVGNSPTNASWFYYVPGSDAVTDIDYKWQKQVRTLTPAVTPTLCVAGSESTAPGDGDGDGDGDGNGDGDGDGDVAGDAEVLGIEAEAPAAAPTAVDAGLSAEETGTSSSLWLFAGAALALAGAVLGFTPARARGKRAR